MWWCAVRQSKLTLSLHRCQKTLCVLITATFFPWIPLIPSTCTKTWKRTSMALTTTTATTLWRLATNPWEQVGSLCLNMSVNDSVFLDEDHISDVFHFRFTSYRFHKKGRLRHRYLHICKPSIIILGGRCGGWMQKCCVCAIARMVVLFVQITGVKVRLWHRIALVFSLIGEFDGNCSSRLVWNIPHLPEGQQRSCLNFEWNSQN